MNPAVDHDVGMSKGPDGALVRRFPVTDLTTAAPATRTESGGFNLDYSVVVALSGLLPPNAPIMSVLLTVPPMCSCSAPMNRPVTKPCS